MHRSSRCSSFSTNLVSTITPSFSIAIADEVIEGCDQCRARFRTYWTSVLRWDPLGRLRRSCASDPRRRYEYEAVFQAQADLVTGMLAIDFEIEKEGMTVPYPPLSNDIRRNHALGSGLQYRDVLVFWDSAFCW
jgi:hypothetical protein